MQEVNIVNEKNVACSTSKQRMLQPLNHHIIASRKTVSPEGIQYRNRLPSLRHPQRCTWRRLRMVKDKILASDSWGPHQRNDFSESRLLHVPKRVYICAQSFSHVWLWNLMDCSLPGSSVHETFHVKILEWVTISFSRVSSWPGDRTWVSYISYIAGKFFASEPTRTITWFLLQRLLCILVPPLPLWNSPS